MSTNYYARTTEDIEHDREGLHIGKSSRGWEFLFRAHPGLDSCAAWHEYLSRNDVHIYAEYGVSVPLSEFWANATTRPADVGGPSIMRSPLGRPERNGFRDMAARGVPFLASEFC